MAIDPNGLTYDEIEGGTALRPDLAEGIQIPPDALADLTAGTADILTDTDLTSAADTILADATDPVKPPPTPPEPEAPRTAVTRVNLAEPEHVGMGPPTSEDAEFFTNTDKLETTILSLSEAMLGSLDEAIKFRTQAKVQDGADVAALDAEIAAFEERRTNLENAIAPLREKGPDERWDDVTDIALMAMIAEMQNDGLRYQINADTIISTGWNREQDGAYSQDYHDYLYNQLKQLEELDAAINAKEEALEDGETLSAEDAQERAIIRFAHNELRELVAVMRDLEQSGAVTFASDPPSAIDNTTELPTIEKDEALTIIDRVLATIAEQHYFDADLGDETYDMGSRRATQVFLLELAKDLGLEDEDGRYSETLRNALTRALHNDEQKAMIAKKYLNDDIATTERLYFALNTLAIKPGVIGDENTPQFIASDTLIYKPQLEGIEARAIDAALDKIPTEELGAINQMSIIMTGFGLENIMPDGTLSEAQVEDLTELEAAQALSKFYASIHAEAIAEVGDSDPQQLEDAITERMVDRFNAIYDDIPAFDYAHKIHLRADIREAVEKAIENYNIEGGTPAERLAAASTAFAISIPDHNSFTTEHGVGMRSIVSYDQDDMEANVTKAIAGYGGAVDKSHGTVDVTAALQAPTIGAMIASIPESYDASVHYEYVDHAGYTQNFGDSRMAFDKSEEAQETYAQVQDGLSAIESILTAAYGDRTAPAIIESANNETYLLSRNEDGEVEIRYLDANGIETLQDPPSGDNFITIDDHLNMDELLIQTAYALHQARNENDSRTIAEHKPIFFKLGDTHYVGGIDKETMTFEIVPMDPDFISDATARMISRPEEGQTKSELFAALSEMDPAYAFLRENYGQIMHHPDNNDLVFNMMARAIGTDEAERARLLADTPKEEGINLEIAEEQHLARRQEALDRATPPPETPTVTPNITDPQATTDIAFIMDRNPDDPNSLEEGVYAKTESGELVNVDLSEADRAQIEATLGINLDAQVRQAFGTNETNIRYQTDKNRFFVMAIHPQNPDLEGGYVMAYTDDDENIRYGYLKASEFDPSNLGMVQKFSAQFIYKDAHGDDRLRITPNENNSAAPLFVKGIYAGPDNAVSPMMNLNDLVTTMNLADWDGTGFYTTYDNRVETGVQNCPLPVDRFAENAASICASGEAGLRPSPIPSQVIIGP